MTAPRLRTESERVGPSTHDGMAGNHIVVPVVAGRIDHGRIVAFSPDGRLQPQDDVTPWSGPPPSPRWPSPSSSRSARWRASTRRDFLRDLLTGRAGPQAARSSHGASLGWDLDRPVVVVVAELDPVPAPAARPVPTPGHTAQPRSPRGPRSTLRRSLADRGPPARPAAPRWPASPTRWWRCSASRPARSAAPDTSPAAVDRYVRDLVREVSGDGGGGRRSFCAGVSRVGPTRPSSRPPTSRRRRPCGSAASCTGTARCRALRPARRLPAAEPGPGHRRAARLRRRDARRARRRRTTRRRPTCGARCRCCWRPTSTSPRRPARCTSTTTRCATGSASWSGCSARSPTTRTCG